MLTPNEWVAVLRVAWYSVEDAPRKKALEAPGKQGEQGGLEPRDEGASEKAVYSLLALPHIEGQQQGTRQRQSLIRSSRVWGSMGNTTSKNPPRGLIIPCYRCHGSKT